MNSEKVAIPVPVVEEIKLYGRENMPLEVCGVFSGKGKKVKKFHRVTNIKVSSRRFLFDSAEQYKVFQQIEKEGREIMGVFHSHPFANARPSDFDVSRAEDTPTWFHLIYSPVKDEIKLFSCAYGRLKFLELTRTS